ncbi:MAG: hypothetical protein GF317_17660, partial [Candidatus Lokiarchaeota archaeon]|nr:hypothetical protein [Candidatus Lokiarchaeota archaeon]MBD3201341.1 hypothetical protein [Candidatus Lokiarchaeota archaeon]
MSEQDIIVFLSEWDAFSGIRIVQSSPSKTIIDIETLSFKIFISFEQKYEIEESNDENFIFTLPLLNENLIARIFIGNYESKLNKKNLNSYLIVILFPYYFENELLLDFDDNIQEINEIYKQEDLSRFDEECEKISEKFHRKQEIQLFEIKLDEKFTDKDALIEFKKGLEFFSRGDYQNSYIYLKKPHLRFKETNNIKFLIQVTYILGISLSKLQKYNASLDYFNSLIEKSNDLGNYKYYKDSIYMSAFCSYKLGEFERALKTLDNAKTQNIDLVDTFKFHYLYGRVLTQLKKIKQAIGCFTRAQEIVDISIENQIKKKTLANFNIEFANLYLVYATNNLIDQIGNRDFKKYYKISIEKYKNTIQILGALGDYQRQIIILKRIGQIYTILGNYREANTYYKNAINITKINNDIISKMQIFDLFLLNLDQTEKYEEMIYEIDKILSELKPYAYIDLYTIANYHYRLGNAFLAINREKKALSEFIISKNIFDKLKNPTKESLDLLRVMYGIYLKKNEKKYIEYYREKIEEYEVKLNQYHVSLEKLNALDTLKKLWVFSNKNKELFYYSSEENTNRELFSGFITGLVNFSKEFSSMKLNTLKIGTDKYFIYREENVPIYVVGKARYTHKEFEILDILK